MKVELITTVFLTAFSAAALAGSQAQDYRKLSPACQSCNQIDALATKHNTEQSPDSRLKYALEIAKLIEKISIKQKPEIEQRREIYYAITGALQVLDDDFDSETCVQLLDLRGQAPKAFDHVLWRFPLVSQQKIIERMRSFKEDNIRPKAQIPEAKFIEN